MQYAFILSLLRKEENIGSIWKKNSEKCHCTDYITTFGGISFEADNLQTSLYDNAKPVIT